MCLITAIQKDNSNFLILNNFVLKITSEIFKNTDTAYFSNVFLCSLKIFLIKLKQINKLIINKIIYSSTDKLTDR